MFEVSESVKMKILKNKGLIVLVLVVLSLLIPSVFSPQATQADKKKEVLAVTAKAVLQIPTPTVTIIPSPTIFIPAPTVAVPSPTPTLTPTQTSVATPTPTPTQTSVDTPTPIPSLTPTLTPTEIPSPTPAGLSIQIGIDYAGQKPADSYTVSVAPGQTAWAAVVAAVGINNLQYTDYGGNMGIFITGFNGVNAASNQYFEFEINGVSSTLGVSNYQCNDGDKLDFVLTSF